MDFETAESMNERYRSKHDFTQQCVDIINDMGMRMRALRAGKEPTVRDGDRIICVRLDGTVVSAHGHIQWGNGNPTICVYPMEPYVDRLSLRCNASGNYWISVSPEDLARLQYRGKAAKTFWTWGPGGPQKNGDLHFPIAVNAWRLVHRAFK